MESEKNKNTHSKASAKHNTFFTDILMPEAKRLSKNYEQFSQFMSTCAFFLEKIGKQILCPDAVNETFQRANEKDFTEKRISEITARAPKALKNVFMLTQDYKCPRCKLIHSDSICINTFYEMNQNWLPAFGPAKVMPECRDARERFSLSLAKIDSQYATT